LPNRFIILEMTDGEQTPRRWPTKSGTKETPYAREDPPSQVGFFRLAAVPQACAPHNLARLRRCG
jgi:hypothetical protein